MLEVNRHPLEFAQVDASTVIGKPLWEFPSWRATPELEEFVRDGVALAAAGHFFHQEVIIPDSNGDLHNFDFSIKPLYATGSDHLVWLLAEGRDITSIVRLQTALR